MHLTLSELAIDLVNNAIAAGADLIQVSWEETDCHLSICVQDNGCGMDRETRKRAIDPFYTGSGTHPGRRVGLGLPFMVQTAEDTGGEWWLESSPGAGTRVGLAVPLGNVDVPVAGDLVGSFAIMLGASEGGELVVSRRRGDEVYTIRRSELLDALGELSSVSSLRLIMSYVESQEESVWDG